jgi:hypothetical protein
MRPTPWLLAERYRRPTPDLGQHAYGDSFGVFSIPKPGGSMMIIVSSGRGWEHVSASLQFRTPTWGEMCEVKNLFWLPSETVLQYHPSEDEYVNCHPHCLHLWRPIDGKIPVPPTWMVGPKR